MGWVISAPTSSVVLGGTRQLTAEIVADVRAQSALLSTRRRLLVASNDRNPCHVLAQVVPTQASVSRVGSGVSQWLSCLKRSCLDSRSAIASRSTYPDKFSRLATCSLPGPVTVLSLTYQPMPRPLRPTRLRLSARARRWYSAASFSTTSAMPSPPPQGPSCLAEYTI